MDIQHHNILLILLILKPQFSFVILVRFYYCTLKLPYGSKAIICDTCRSHVPIVGRSFSHCPRYSISISIIPNDWLENTGCRLNKLTPRTPAPVNEAGDMFYVSVALTALPLCSAVPSFTCMKAFETWATKLKVRSFGESSGGLFDCSTLPGMAHVRSLCHRVLPGRL